MWQLKSSWVLGCLSARCQASSLPGHRPERQAGWSGLHYVVILIQKSTFQVISEWTVRSGVATTSRIRSRRRGLRSGSWPSDRGAALRRTPHSSPRQPNWHGFMCTEPLVLLGLRVGHEVLNGQANPPCPQDGHGVPRQSLRRPKLFAQLKQVRAEAQDAAQAAAERGGAPGGAGRGSVKRGGGGRMAVHWSGCAYPARGVFWSVISGWTEERPDLPPRERGVKDRQHVAGQLAQG
jgi:hypothetical protein